MEGVEGRGELKLAQGRGRLIVFTGRTGASRKKIHQGSALTHYHRLTFSPQPGFRKLEAHRSCHDVRHGDRDKEETAAEKGNEVVGRIRLTSHGQVHSIKKLVCDGITGICTGAITKIQNLEWYKPWQRRSLSM